VVVVVVVGERRRETVNIIFKRFAVSRTVKGKGSWLTKGGGRIGDVIVVTKKLGVGAYFADEMRGGGGARAREQVIDSMMESNKIAGDVAAKLNKETGENAVRSATDVTGFGLMGHLIEMVKASRKVEEGKMQTKMRAKINLEKIAFLNGGVNAAVKGVFSSLQEENYKCRGGVSNHDECLARWEKDDQIMAKYLLLFNPETSGGLLFFVRAAEADAFVKELAVQGVEGVKVGDLEELGEDESGEGEYCAVVDKEKGTGTKEKIRKGADFVRVV